LKEKFVVDCSDGMMDRGIRRKGEERDAEDENNNDKKSME
jgi:hypothetical protein